MAFITENKLTSIANMTLSKITTEKRREEVREALKLGPVTLRQISDASRDFKGLHSISDRVNEFRRRREAHIHDYVRVAGGHGWAARYIWGKGADAALPQVNWDEKASKKKAEDATKWAEGREKKKKAIVKVQRCEFENYFFGPAKIPKKSKKGRQTEP